MKVCVFLGAKNGAGIRFEPITLSIANEFARREITLVYGGSREGLMGSLANSLLALSGKVIGVMPSIGLPNEIAHPELTELIFAPDVDARKRKMIEIADAFLALPGGIGTFEEIFKVWNAIKLNQLKKPLFILNSYEYYNPIINLIDQCIDEGFLHDTPLINICQTPEEVFSHVYFRELLKVDNLN